MPWRFCRFTLNFPFYLMSWSDVIYTMRFWYGRKFQSLAKSLTPLLWFFRQLIYALKLGLNALSPATPTAQICVVSVDQQVLYNVLTDLWREVPFEKMKPQPQ